MLGAHGAEVVLTPTAVERTRPSHTRFVATRRGDPGRLQARSVLEHVEPEAHYLTTGPEILEQTGATRRDRDDRRHRRHDHGVGRYFKERKPEVKIVGVDPEGSVYTAKSETTCNLSSRASARTRGPRRSTRRSSTCGSRLRSRFVPRRAPLAREEGLLSAARRARRSRARSVRENSVQARAC